MQEGLRVDIQGLEIKNPTILAAGILGLSGPILEQVVEAGAGAVVTKSLGLAPRMGYPNPTIVDVGCGFLNAMGLPNPGIRDYKKEIKHIKTSGVPVIVSIYGYSPEDFAEVAKEAEMVGADALELNLSCPHVEGLGMQMGKVPELVADVVSKVKSEVGVPVFAKLSSSFPDIALIAKAAENGGSDGITAINTVKAMAIDVETGMPILANGIGGLSGPAIKPIAIRCVYQIACSVEIPVIGCGGITDWRDAVEFMLAGASAVQIGTAIAYKGLGIFMEISDGIRSYLKKKGYRGVNEIVGLAHRH